MASSFLLNSISPKNSVYLSSSLSQLPILLLLRQHSKKACKIKPGAGTATSFIDLLINKTDKEFVTDNGIMYANPIGTSSKLYLLVGLPLVGTDRMKVR